MGAHRVSGEGVPARIADRGRLALGRPPEVAKRPAVFAVGGSAHALRQAHPARKWLIDGNSVDAIEPVLSILKSDGTAVDYSRHAFYIVRVCVHALIQAMVSPPPGGCPGSILGLFEQLRMIDQVQAEC